MPDFAALVQAIYLFVALMGFALTALLSRNPDQQGAVSLTILNLAIGWWSLCLFVSTVAPDSIALMAIRLMYLGVVVVPLILFVFGLSYTGRERFLTPRILGVLALHPVVTVVFAFANPADLFFRTLDPDVAFGVEQVWGPAFYVHTVISYLLVLGLMVMLLELLVTSRQSLYRGQAIALFLAIMAPLVANAVFIAELVQFDTTPIGFGGTTAMLTFAMVRYRLGDVAPIGRDKVVDNIRDGMFIVDTKDRIIDTNPVAETIVGLSASEIVGSHVQETFAEFPAILDTYEEVTAEPTSSREPLELGDLHLRIKATPIEDDRDRHVGWLLLVADVTEQKRSKRELERQIETLDQFASLVSHDLRNPINVARGYVQQTQATGDLDHLEKTDEAFDRMEAIIDDVLALAREGGDVTEPTPTSVAAVSRAAWDTVDTGAATLEVDDAVEDLEVMADRDRFQRLLENLVRNSIEHGADASARAGDETADHTVWIRLAEETGSEATIVVEDDGVGIPAADRETIFEEGYTTHDEGTGLGLAIVDQIARAHGWEVAATESQTGGAAFEITGVGKPMPATQA